LYKLFTRIIQKRIVQKLDFNQTVEQAGFRKSFSTTDHLQTINQIIEKYNEYNMTLYIAFVDYSKAFDSLEHGYIWRALKEQGVEGKYIRILKFIYENATARIKTEIEGPLFDLKKGVKQGDPISPKLFIATLQRVFNILNWKTEINDVDGENDPNSADGNDKFGLKINGKILTDLRFADDIVLFAEDAKSLENMLNQLHRESKKVGLHINMTKTKIMSSGTREEIKMGNDLMEYVEDYVYLGQVMSFKDRQELEIGRRIGNAWKGFWRYRDYLLGNLPLILKRKIMDDCILPTLTYGSQTWSLTKIQEDRLAKTQRAMERKILGISLRDRRRNVEIRKKTGIRDVGTMAKSLKWNWAGHLLRTRDERWSKSVTEWYPRENKRKRGRPRARWRDDFDHYVGKTWMQLTTNKELWKMNGEAFAQLRDANG
jgi:hypothetical protein